MSENTHCFKFGGTWLYQIKGACEVEFKSKRKTLALQAFRQHEFVELHLMQPTHTVACLIS